MLLSSLVRFFLLVVIKYLVMVFYRCRCSWVGDRHDFSKIRLALILNHTSLFEPMFVAMVPLSLIWRIASKGIVPGADVTLSRPVAGRFFRWLASDMVSISRKRDDTWSQFKEAITPESIIVFLPEGRMKRPDGKDKNGHPMTVRKGVVEILGLLGQGRMLFCYSGGLHQVQAPGQKWPNLFKTISMVFENVEISEYLAQFSEMKSTPRYADAIAQDMENRRDRCVPTI